MHFTLNQMLFTSIVYTSQLPVKTIKGDGTLETLIKKRPVYPAGARQPPSLPQAVQNALFL